MLERYSRILLVAVALAGCKSKGVDLGHGGTELAFSLAEPAGSESRLNSDLEAAARVAIERLNLLKVDAKVAPDGNQLVVKIPASVKPEALASAKKLLALRGLLEFREVNDGAPLKEVGNTLPEDSDVKVQRLTWQDANNAQHGAFVVEAQSEADARKALAGAKLPPGTELVMEKGGAGRQRLWALNPAAFANDAIQNAKAPSDAYLPPEVEITFTESAGRRFEDLTRKMMGRRLAVVLDGTIFQSEVVLAAIAGGKTSLALGDEGDRKARQQDVTVLAMALKSGPMPAPIKLDAERPISSR